jgi:small subunit ribosomal protein S6
MNIECGAETLTELEHAYKFNDAVLRHLIVAMPEAVATPSPMMKEEKARSLTGRDADRVERPDRPERPAAEATAQPVAAPPGPAQA